MKFRGFIKFYLLACCQYIAKCDTGHVHHRKTQESLIWMKGNTTQSGAFLTKKRHCALSFEHSQCSVLQSCWCQSHTDLSKLAHDNVCKGINHIIHSVSYYLRYKHKVAPSTWSDLWHVSPLCGTQISSKTGRDSSCRLRFWKDCPEHLCVVRLMRTVYSLLGLGNMLSCGISLWQ